MPDPNTPQDAIDVQQLRREVAAVQFWWHRIDLGHGVITPGKDKSAERLPRIGLPRDLSGKSVLDIGAWDGFFSFEAERRGAARVVAADRWDLGTGGDMQAGFQLARRALGSKVESVRKGVLELNPADLGTFDVVLFLGVLYHLQNPVGALRRVRELTRELMILDTETDLLWCGRPALAFYPGRELRGDPTNWCAPNMPGLRAMLLVAGFSRVEVVWRMPLHVRLARAWRDRREHGSSLWSGLQRDRVIVHAHV